MNKKSVYALAATVASYLLTYKISRPETELHGAVGLIAVALLVGLLLAALVFAILSLREVDADRNANRALGYLPAIGALVLVFLLVLPFGYRALSHWRDVRELRKNAGPSTWTRFTSPTGDFTVLLPEAATETTQTVQRADGPITLRSVVAIAGAGASYSVMVGEVPDDAGESSTARLDELEADFVRRSNGKLVSSSTVSTGAVVGRELRVTSAERSVRVRIFVMNRHIYQVLVIRPPPSEESALDERFLGSFTLHGA
ncbi:MAG TPA: hypothetical protein VM925_28465 [Labilithrix sp.]|jgi:hypothetical protein|nr:hypothetical protein [Labilithrix sp.]